MDATAQQETARRAGTLAPVVLRPGTLGAAGAFTLTMATLAAVVSLPGCGEEPWLPLPLELPELGRC